MAKAGVDKAHQQNPHWIPRALPGNEDAYKAFYIIRHCRIFTMNGAAGFDWQQVAAKLDVHGLWSAEMERKLSIIEAHVVLTEREVEAGEELRAQQDNKHKHLRGKGR